MNSILGAARTLAAFSAATLMLLLSAPAQAVEASGWVDLDVLSVAVRLADGNLQCASYDGINCSWGTTALAANQAGASLKPLSCGADHKKAYGVTGYDTSGHWCSVAYARLYANWNTPGNVGLSINPDGDLQCMATDGRNCLWGTYASPEIIHEAMPLACGPMHNAIWGVTGYNATHWCTSLNPQRAFTTYDPTTWYYAGNVVRAYGRQFRLCNGASLGDLPGVNNRCAVGNPWEDLGWVVAPSSAPLWQIGRAYKKNDVAQYAGKVYAVVQPFEAGSPQSKATPERATWGIFPWMEVGNVN